MKEYSQTDKDVSKVSEFKSELKSAAERVEAISAKLKAKNPSADWEELHDLASRIEHFMDKSAGAEKPFAPLSYISPINESAPCYRC